MTRNEEILTILQEECAEVIQAVSKVKRFGLEGNVEDLKKELCDLQCMINLMSEFDVVQCENCKIEAQVFEMYKTFSGSLFYCRNCAPLVGIDVPFDYS